MSGSKLPNHRLAVGILSAIDLFHGMCCGARPHLAVFSQSDLWPLQASSCNQQPPIQPVVAAHLQENATGQRDFFVHAAQRVAEFVQNLAPKPFLRHALVP